MLHYSDILRIIDIKLTALSCALFCLGLFLSLWVVKKKLRIFLFFPLWIWRLVKRYLSPNDHFLKIFLFIFFLNSISLFANLVSGFLLGLPLIFAILLGINIGIIILTETGRLDYIAIFLNPVSLFELPAAWISLSMGIKISISLYPNFVFWSALQMFYKGLYVYFLVIIPLLIISGLIEAALIKVFTKNQFFSRVK